MYRTRPFLGAILILLVLAGCTAATNGGLTTTGGDIILRDEILATGRGNAYEVLELTRPLWLRERSDQSANRQGGIIVYLDEGRFGGLGDLRTIPARDIQRIQRYNTTAASQRWGPGHSEGVIQISTRTTN